MYKIIKLPKGTKRYELFFILVVYLAVYSHYILGGELPSNPVGFYASSIEVLVDNIFTFPRELNRYGEGIPYVYPPLGFYISAILTYFTGSIIATMNYFPGIFHLLQSFLLFYFVYKWKSNFGYAKWSLVIFMFMPQVLVRDLYADGILTTLSRVFLLLSWVSCIIGEGEKKYYYSIMGGLLVGASILTHPIVGVLCAVGYPVVLASNDSPFRKNANRLFISILSSLIIVSPWLIGVVVNHGVDPLIAGLSDSKSGFSIFTDFGSFAARAVSKYYEGLRSFAYFTIIPFGISVIYCIVSKKWYITALLVLSLIAGKGYPIVSAFLISICAGIFLEDVFSGVKDVKFKGYWDSYGIYIIVPLLLIISFGIFSREVESYSSVGNEEIKLYSWIKNNTPQDSKILKTGSAENIPFFTNRSIIFPALGAEWIPSNEFRNGQEENRYKKRKIFECSEEQCFVENMCSIKNAYIVHENNGSTKFFLNRMKSKELNKIVYKNNKYIVAMPRYEKCSQ